MMNQDWRELIVKHQLGQLSDEEFSRLEEQLRTSDEARTVYHRMARMDSALRREAEASRSEEPERAKVISFHRKPFLSGLAAAAAVVILSAISLTIAAQKRTVATLVSTEDAAWESSLPTVEGAALTRGSLRLAEGIATIRLDSGVVLTLEAPARLFLKGPAKASLVNGTVISRAEGVDEFMLEVPLGQAVVSNGEVLATVWKDKTRARFEMISGEAFVSHDESRDALKLEGGDAAFLKTEGIASSENVEEPEPIQPFEHGLRLLPEDRTTTFIGNNNPHKWTRPEFLTLKKSISGNQFDQHSVIAFDLSGVPAGAIREAVLRLNFVPSGLGQVSLLPKVNRFAVYGLVNPEKEDWSRTDPWENAPAPADGKLVGEFEMPRSQQSGVVEISGDRISELVREKSGRSVSLIVVRETTRLEGYGNSYVHAIASASHPETVGPVLELFLK